MLRRALCRQLSLASRNRFARYTDCSALQGPRRRRARVRAAQDRMGAVTAPRPRPGSGPAPRGPDDPRRARMRALSSADTAATQRCWFSTNGSALTVPTKRRTRKHLTSQENPPLALSEAAYWELQASAKRSLYSGFAGILVQLAGLEPAASWVRFGRARYTNHRDMQRFLARRARFRAVRMSRV
jgi:hypothetical protein